MYPLYRLQFFSWIISPMAFMYGMIIAQKRNVTRCGKIMSF
jgi:hypothetical protein